MGIGPVKFKRMVERFKYLSKAYWANREDLEEILGRTQSLEFIGFRSRFDPVRRLEELKEKGIAVLTPEDYRFPKNLTVIADPPICLYVKGSLKNEEFFSVIGSRHPTQYGLKVGYELAFGLAKAGFTIVSGLALGIDGVAHWGAIDAKGKTVAVMGCVDVVYPHQHLDLYRKIIASGGAIVSEFPPGLRLCKGMFVSRNRIVSGMSKGILVVEGGDHSGTLITASMAANQGRDLFAVPGQITNDMSSAPNILIKQGAKMVTEIGDILEEYQTQGH